MPQPPSATVDMPYRNPENALICRRSAPENCAYGYRVGGGVNAEKDAVVAHPTAPAVAFAFQLQNVARKGIIGHLTDPSADPGLVLSGKLCVLLSRWICDQDGPSHEGIRLRIRVRRARAQPRLCG